MNIVFLLAGSFVALVALLAWFALNRVETRIRSDAGDAMQTVLHTTRESLTLWANNNRFLLGRLGANPQLATLVENQLAVPRTKKDLLNSPALAELNEMFRLVKDRFDTSDFYVISPDFINIAGTQAMKLGARNLIAGQRLDLLNRVFQGEAVMVPPVWSEAELGFHTDDTTGSQPIMFFMAPIKNDEGEIIAAMAHQIEPTDDFTRLTQLGRMGKTGETYAFDNYGRLLSESRFDEEISKIGLLAEGQRGILT